MGLPDYLQQGLGWQPDPTTQYDGLHPAVMQGLGLSPPPDLTPDPDPATGLPPLQDYTPPPVAPGFDAPPSPPVQQQPDFRVPAAAIDGPGTHVPAAAPRPQPPVRPVSPEQGFASAAAHSQQATNEAKAAVVQEAQASQQQSAADLDVYKKNVDEEKRLNAESSALRDQKTKALAGMQARVDANRAAVDDYKVDQDKYWKETGIGTHAGWYIGLALSSFGDALLKRNGPNPVLQMMQDKIHENVAAQVDKRAQLEKKFDRSREAMGEVKNDFAGREAEIAAGRAQGDRMLAKSLALAGAQSADPMIRAKAQAAIAQLDQSAADHETKAVETGAQYQIQKQQVGIAAGHLGLAAQAERRQQKLQDLEYGPGGFKEQELGLKAADEMRKMLQAKKDKAGAEGVYNPVTGDALLTKAGQAQMQQADALEAAARKDPAAAAQPYIDRLRAQATTPESKVKVDQLEAQIKQNPAAAAQVASQYVAKLRDEANTDGVATIGDKEMRREVVKGIANGQKLINATAKIKAFLKNDPDVTDREGWSKLQTLYGDAKSDYIASIGAKASSREFEAISDHIMKYDPDSLIDRVFRKAPGVASLDGLDEAVKGGVDAMLKSNHIQDGWTPKSPLDSPAETVGARTGDDAAAAVEPSSFQKAAATGLDAAAGFPYNVFGIANPHIFRPEPGDEWDVQKQARADSDAAHTSVYGLPQETDVKLHKLIKQADVVNNERRAQIVEQIADPIIKNDRPSLSMGLLRTVKDEDPSLYEDILARLPPMQAQEIRKYDTPTNALEPTGTHPRQSTIRNVDEAKNRADAAGLDAFKNRR